MTHSETDTECDEVHSFAYHLDHWAWLGVALFFLVLSLRFLVSDLRNVAKHRSGSRRDSDTRIQLSRQFWFCVRMHHFMLVITVAMLGRVLDVLFMPNMSRGVFIAGQLLMEVVWVTEESTVVCITVFYVGSLLTALLGASSTYSSMLKSWLQLETLTSLLAGLFLFCLSLSITIWQMVEDTLYPRGFQMLVWGSVNACTTLPWVAVCVLVAVRHFAPANNIRAQKSQSSGSPPSPANQDPPHCADQSAITKPPQHITPQPSAEDARIRANRQRVTRVLMLHAAGIVTLSVVVVFEFLSAADYLSDWSRPFFVTPYCSAGFHPVWTFQPLTQLTIMSALAWVSPAWCCCTEDHEETHVEGVGGGEVGKLRAVEVKADAAAGSPNKSPHTNNPHPHISPPTTPAQRRRALWDSAPRAVVPKDSIASHSRDSEPQLVSKSEQQ